MPSNLWKRLFLVLPVTVVVLAAFFLMAASPVDPLAFEPPPAPAMDGTLAPNEHLAEADYLGAGQIHGPEDVAVDAEGRVYAGLIGGRIVRISADGQDVETVADTGGRPLGIRFDAMGDLIVADGLRGLVRVTLDGEMTTLTDSVDGEPFGFADHLAIATDGRVYFSDASTRFGYGEHLYDLLEARPHGRLLRYDPAAGTTEVLLDDLYFANGVALSAAEDYVLVNETYRYRITRYWLAGERAGTSDVFLDNLPGFADNLSSSGRGTFWVACFTVRNPKVDELHPSAYLKRQLAKLPAFLWPKPAAYGLAFELGEDGKILRSFQDPGGARVPQITTAVEHAGQLYLGNLDRDFVGRVSLD